MAKKHRAGDKPHLELVVNNPNPVIEPDSRGVQSVATRLSAVGSEGKETKQPRGQFVNRIQSAQNLRETVFRLTEGYEASKKNDANVNKLERGLLFVAQMAMDESNLHPDEFIEERVRPVNQEPPASVYSPALLAGSLDLLHRAFNYTLTDPRTKDRNPRLLAKFQKEYPSDVWDDPTYAKVLLDGIDEAALVVNRLSEIAGRNPDEWFEELQWALGEKMGLDLPDPLDDAELISFGIHTGLAITKAWESWERGERPAVPTASTENRPRKPKLKAVSNVIKLAFGEHTGESTRTPWDPPA